MCCLGVDGLGHLTQTHKPFRNQATTKQLAKNWIVSYLGNLFGTALLAGLCQYAGVFSAPTASGIAAIATAKASLPFGVAVARGVRACLAPACRLVFMLPTAD